MIDIKEMLRRRERGQGARSVARDTGCDRKMVARYFAAAAALSLSLSAAREPGSVAVR